jgi:hypothetical protein
MYLKKGESGIGVAALADFSKGGKEFSLQPSYTYKGYLDITPEFSKAFLDDKMEDFNGDEHDVTGTSYGVQATAYPVKEDEKIPVTLAVSLNYAHLKLDSKALDISHIDMTGNAMGAAVGLSRNVGFGNGFSITPHAQYNFSSTKTTVEFKDETLGFGPDQSETNKSWDVGAGIDLQKTVAGNSSLILLLQFALDDEGDNSQGVGIAFLQKLP